MTYSYPLLNKVINYYKNLDSGGISDCHIISCQHLLEPQIEMYKGFIEIGIKPENIIILGKIYSTNQSVLDELKNLGIKVLQPQFSGKAFDEEHHKNCEDLLGQLSGQKIIILDDGAELIHVFSKSYSHVDFAVEQTSSGFRKLENLEHKFPVINVARSKTKLTQESPLIARLCFDRISQYVEKYNIENPKFLLIGLGPIGESMREIITEKGFKIDGYDKEDYTSIVELINSKKPDVVIGATGTQIISKTEILDISNYTNFISLSSSDREFPASSFRSSDNPHEDIFIHNFRIANGGFPITFMGNRYESTPIEIEKTIALLFGSVAHGIKVGYTGNGLIDVPEELEKMINS